MSDVKLRLDRTRALSTVHGDRTPMDPHYRVHYWQGGLPFDVSGELIPDDGSAAVREENIDNGDGTFRRITYSPLWNDGMRKLLAKKVQRIEQIAAAPKDDESEEGKPKSEDVNLEAWLRGEVDYEWFLIAGAAKARFSKNYTNKRDLVEDMVFDERIIPEDQLSPALARVLGQKAA